MIDQVTDVDDIALSVAGDLDGFVRQIVEANGPHTARDVLANVLAELHVLKPEYARIEAEWFSRLLKRKTERLLPEQALALLDRVERRVNDLLQVLSAAAVRLRALIFKLSIDGIPNADGTRMSAEREP